MKRVILVSLLGLFMLTGFSQETPLYSLNFQNRFVTNPARTGFNERPELYLMYRKQWVGFNGAPETRAASFDMNFRKGGFGVYVYNDITDLFRTWAGYLSYAYHLDFNDKHRLSIGLAAGVKDYSYDTEKAFVKDALDPALQGDHAVAFDGSAGVNYFLTGDVKSKTKGVKAENDSLGTANDTAGTKTVKHSLLNFSIGISALSVFATNLQYLNDDRSSTGFVPDRHYLAIVSNEFKLFDEKLLIEPMVIARFPESFNYQIEAGLKIGYKDWVWASGMYRHDYGVTVGAGFKVHDAIKIGYAYDIALNDIKDYQNGSHEIMLGIVFGKRRDKLASKEELDDLKERVMKQDSLISELQEEQDSLMKKVDSLEYEVDSLKELLSSGEFMSEDEGVYDDNMLNDMDNLSEEDWKAKYGEEEYDRYKSKSDKLKQYDETVSNLEKRIKNLEKQIEQTMDELDMKVKDIENEMTEERTRIVSEEDLEVKRGPAIGDYFMVVGSFRIEENSYNFQEDLKRRGYDAGVVYDKKRKWYYVFIAQPKELKKGLQDLYKLREENAEFHDAWIHIMRGSMK